MTIYTMPVLGITPADMLTQNKTRTMNRWQLAKAQKLIKGMAVVSAAKARIPRGLAPAQVILHYAPQTKHHRDCDGIAAMMKPILDALIQRGVWPDDDSRYITMTSQRIEPVEKVARLWLTISTE